MPPCKDLELPFLRILRDVLGILENGKKQNLGKDWVGVLLVLKQGTSRKGIESAVAESMQNVNQSKLTDARRSVNFVVASDRRKGQRSWACKDLLMIQSLLFTNQE